MIRDLRKLPYDPVEMTWERRLRRGTIRETCILVTLWLDGPQDVLRLAPRYGMDAVVTWSQKDELAVFRDTTNGRDFVAWDARDSFDLEACRSITWDRLGPRFRSIGDSDDSVLRGVRRYDSELPDRVHPYRVMRIRKELFEDQRLNYAVPARSLRAL